MQKDKNLIELFNVTRTYQVDTKTKNALDNVSLSFPSRGLIGVIGKSGSGKSTLLNVMALLDKPTSGEILFDGDDIKKWKEKRKRKYRHTDIGMIFQHYNLVENETVMYNIMLPCFIKGMKYKEAENKAKTLLDSISFKKELYEQRVFNLSGGEKQRVAILRALINDPKVIFADEPTGALDSRNSFLIMKNLKKISQGKLVIVVSHNLVLIEKFADKIISLKDGKVYERK